MVGEFCPNCGNPRTGWFRFCRSCGFDFDAPSAGTAGPYGDLADPCTAAGGGSAPADPTAAVPIPATSTPSPAGTVQGRSLPVRFAMAGLVLVLLTTLGFAYKPVGMPGATTSGGVATTADTSSNLGWSPPSGFERFSGDTSIAYRWLERKEFACLYGYNCWALEVIPHEGCPNNLYVELTLQDRSGTAVGYTNDTVGSVDPDQKATVTLRTFEEGAEIAHIGDISCY